MTEEQAKKMAEEHWKWLEPLLHELYVGSFIHGAKHEKGGSDAKSPSR
ncbi:unnamed protein product [marine sediment metagenome]|uniref:Uncharacterized protein n=1 Tax=marine sediment metagenome TaxID=412755 RepID=X1UYN0_9ZZZZ